VNQLAILGEETRLLSVEAVRSRDENEDVAEAKQYARTPEVRLTVWKRSKDGRAK